MPRLYPPLPRQHLLKEKQSIPEHRHLNTEGAGTKLEGWHVRHGSILTYGEDENAKGDPAKILPSHKDCLVAKTAVKVMPGEVAMLNGPEEWHWMKAGPQGAIVTEYGTPHDGEGIRFTHPDAKM